MAFDGIMLAAVVHELSGLLIGGRIDKIYQPEADEAVLLVRAGGGNHRLLLCANANFGRLHLTVAAKENPLAAPMFCMLLRKHLQGGRIVSITQPDFERIVHISVENLDEMGDVVQRRLVVEIMGKYSNVILTDGASDTVLDSIKHVSYGQSSVRQILPGRKYAPPPAQDKRNPLGLDEAEFLEICGQNGGLTAAKLIFYHYRGISPSSAGIICQAGGLDPGLPVPTDARTALFSAFAAIMADVRHGRFTPFVIGEENAAPAGFAVIGRGLYGDFVRDFATPSGLAEFYYAAKDSGERVRQKSQDMRKHVQNLIERCVKKAQVHEKTLDDVAGRDDLKLYGELITAGIYAIEAGAKSYDAINFYEEDAPQITIPLDSAKTAAENAQAYFAKYNKQKRTYGALQQQIAQNMEELQYLEGVREAIGNSHDEADLAQIREELASQGFIKRQPPKKKGKEKKAKPLQYISSDGFDILVGKNNAQNDEITLRTAAQDDIWLHTKNIPGSHVILRAKNGRVTDTALEDAAHLAAYYSRARGGSLVPVDYCPRKQVKKPSGAKPGFVIYEGHKTAYITPDEGRINALRIVDS